MTPAALLSLLKSSPPDVFPFQESVIGFILVVFVLHSYLDIRQLRALHIPKPPKYVAKQYTAKEYKQKQAYNIDKWWYGQANNLFTLALTLASLFGRYMPWLWTRSGQWLALVPALPQNEIMQSIVFFLADSLLRTIISIPWSVYSTFVIEQRHGFNKQTVGTFVSDVVKKLLLGFILAPPILAGFVYLLQTTGKFVALYVWAFVLVISLVFMTIYPTFIAPLFNKFDPLPDGELRDGIEELAASLKFPLKKLFVIDGSKRSAHSNAYMYGFFNNKRIVLFDTLVEQCTIPQTVAVLAHELGHWKLWHTPVLFVVGQAVLLSQLGLFTLVRTNTDLLRSFGFAPGVEPAFISFMLFQIIIAPVDEVIGFLSNVLSRTFEFQADRFAAQLDHGPQLKEALMVLDKENKSAINVDKLYSTYHYTHPPVVERLQAIDGLMKKST